MLGAKRRQMSFSSPTVTQTGQESGDQLCGNFQILIVSVSVNRACKLLQLMGDEVPRPPYRSFAPGPHWGTFVPKAPWATAPI